MQENNGKDGMYMVMKFKMNRDFHIDYDWSKKFIELWDAFWTKKYPQATINRDIPIDLDKLGVDLILTYDKGRRLLIDEKVTCDIFPDYPIEIVKNTQLSKDGWGWSNKGITIGFGKHPEKTVSFTSEPIIFEINDKFQSRILQSPPNRYVCRMLGTLVGDGKYNTLIMRVPHEDLCIFNDDYRWAQKYGLNRKLWEF